MTDHNHHRITHLRNARPRLTAFELYRASVSSMTFSEWPLPPWFAWSQGTQPPGQITEGCTPDGCTVQLDPGDAEQLAQIRAIGGQLDTRG